MTEEDLYALLASSERVVRDALLDALNAGTEPPVVLVGDRIACSGGIDLDAVVRTAEG